MKITKKNEGNTVTCLVEGRLDTMTAPELEKDLSAETNMNKLILDFSNLEYISSAGLRVLLILHKKMCQKDGLTIQHPNEMVNEVFEVTGFSDIFTIEV